MKLLFVPVFFVCWINGQCLEGWKEDVKFELEDECIMYTHKWMAEELYDALITQGKGMAFRVQTACMLFPDGDTNNKHLTGEKTNVLFKLP